MTDEKTRALMVQRPLTDMQVLREMFTRASITVIDTGCSAFEIRSGVARTAFLFKQTGELDLVLITDREGDSDG